MSIDLDAIEARWLGDIDVTDPYQALIDMSADLAALVAEVRTLRAVADAVTDFRQRTANMSVVSYDRASEAWHRVIAALDAWRGGEGK